MPDYGREHEGAGRGDPDIGTAAAASDLDCGCGGEAAGKVTEELGVSGVVVSWELMLLRWGRGTFLA